MSIPRDLKVEIPGVGTEKFNAAYTYGGPKLTLQVVKELTGLQINHVVNVDFLGFVRAVDAIGCVYVDVDRRYYHSNVGVPAVRTVFGNQHPARLPAALRQKSAAVRALPPHRHRPRPLGPPAGLHQRRPPAGLAPGPGLRPERPDRHLHQIHHLRHQRQGDDAGSAETRSSPRATPRSRRSTSRPNSGPATSTPPRGDPRSGRRIPRRAKRRRPAVPRTEGEGRRRRSKRSSKGKPRRTKKKKPHRRSRSQPGSDGLVPAVEAGEAEGEVVARKVGGGFPVFYPTRLPSGGRLRRNQPLRTHPGSARLPPRRTATANATPPTGWSPSTQPEYEVNYFGVQGIQGWADPPILDNPSETRTIHGREYEIFVDGEQRQADRLAPRRQHLLGLQQPASSR